MFKILLGALATIILLGAMFIPQGHSIVRKQEHNSMSKFVAQKNAKKSKYSTNDNPHYKSYKTVF